MNKPNYFLLTLIAIFGFFYVFQKNTLTASALILEKNRNTLAELTGLSNNEAEQYNLVNDSDNLESIKGALGMQEVKNISFLIIGPSNLAFEKKNHE